MDRRRVLDTVLPCSTIATKYCYKSVPEVEQNLGVLDCLEYGVVFMYPWKVSMVLLVLDVDLVPSGV